MNKNVALGAGCFWGVESLLQKQDGIIKTTVGYAAGHTEHPTYKEVCTGSTGHAEVVLVEFNPTKISLKEILSFFWRLHDPTTLNRQHNDIGTQYRSIILCESDADMNTAKESKQNFDLSNVFENPAVTEIDLLTKFYPAEEEHQDYLIKNPAGYMCHILRDK